MSIQIEHLHKEYDGKIILEDISLVLPERGIIGLSGPSGCGKTTMLRLLAGLIQADSGEIAGMPDRSISMVFQEDRLLPWLSALENIALVLPERQAAASWLQKMQLEEWADYYPAALSGGMKRRIALARALAFDSKILLLDEPFQGMDADLKQLIYELIRDAGRTRLVILVTHDSADILEVADQILVAAGPPLSLITMTPEQYLLSQKT